MRTTLNTLLRWMFCHAMIFTSYQAFAQQPTIKDVDAKLEEARAYFDNADDTVLVVLAETSRQSKNINYLLGEANALTMSGRYLIKKDLLDSGLFCLNAARSIFEDNQLIGDSITSGFNKLLGGLALYHTRKRDFSKGEYYSKLTLSLYKKEDNKVRARNTLVNLGVNNGMQAKYPEALQYFLEAYQMTNDSAANSTIINNIATCYNNMGQSEKAAEYYREGLKIDTQKGWPAQVHKLNNLFTIYNGLEDPDSAIYFGKKALDASKKFGLGGPAAIALSNLSNLYAAQSQYQLAKQYLQEANQLSDSLGLPEVMPGLHFVRAKLYYAEGNISAARFHAKKGLQFALNDKNLTHASSLAKLLSVDYENSRIPDSALYFFKQHARIEDSLFNKKNQLAFTRLYSEMESLEKQKEIEQLKAEKELQDSRRSMRALAFAFVITLLVAAIITLIYREKNRKKKQTINELRLHQALQEKETELKQQTLHMITLSNNMSEVEQKLKEVKKKTNLSKQDVQKVLSNISVQKSMGEEWNKFESYFANIHSEFGEELLTKHGNLSRQERRLIALIKMDLNNREIANLFNIEPRSVSMNKYRLKQKLGLTENDDLEDYINQLFGVRKN